SSRCDKKPWPRRGGPPRARGEVRSACGGGADAARLARAAQLFRGASLGAAKAAPINSESARHEVALARVLLGRLARRLHALLGRVDGDVLRLLGGVPRALDQPLAPIAEHPILAARVR